MRTPLFPPVPQPAAVRTPHSSHGGNIYAFARARGLTPDRVLDFSASINPLGLPAGARAAYRRALSRVGSYPEPYAESLTTALAEYHELDPAGVLVGNGATHLIHLLARTVTARRVLVVAPLFSEHETAFRLSGVHVERFFLRPPEFGLSLERLREKLAKGYDVLVLTNPNSPTGALVLRDHMKEVVRVCQRARVTLVVDESFMDWVEEESFKHLATRSSHVIVVRSLTKFFALPGLRLGYLIAQPKVRQRLQARLEPWAVNTAAQAVALACLRDPSFARRSRTFMVRERTWLFAQLAALPGLQPVPSQTNFLLVRITLRTLRAVELTWILAHDNLLIRACDNFPGLGRQFFRVAVRARADNCRLLTALRVALS